MRPGGMFVRRPHVGVVQNDIDCASSSCGSMIKITVYGGSSQHELHLPAQSTFGDVKKLLMHKTGLEPEGQHLFFRAREKEDEENLHMAGVKDNSAILLFKDTSSKERKHEETGKNNEMLKASEAGSEVRAEVDKLSERAAPLHMEGVKDNSTILLFEDATSKERKHEETRRNNEMLKASEAGSGVRAEVDKLSERVALLHAEGVKDDSTILLFNGATSKEMKHEEIRKNNEMLKASEAIVGVRAEVDKISERVAALQVAVDGGNKTSEKEFLVLTELLMRQLLKLDGIKAKGQVKLQRKTEVCRMQNFVDTLDSLKARNANLYSSTSNAVPLAMESETFGSTFRATSRERKHKEIRKNNELLDASEAVAVVRAEVDKLSKRVAALEVAVDGGTKVSEKEFLVLTELLMKQLLKLDGIEAEGEVKLQRKDEVCRVQNFVDTLDSLKARSANPVSSTSNAREAEEIRINDELLWASKVVAAVRAEVDMLSERVAALEVVVDGVTEVSEEEFLVLTELLKRQSLKLDGIEAEGEVKLQIKDEVYRVQNFVDTLDSLKERNANPFTSTSNAGKVEEELGKNNELQRVSEAVAAVRAEVDMLSERVDTLEVVVDGGTEVSEEEFLMLKEMLMRELLKLDGIEAEGEVKSQIKDEVCRVQNFVDALDSLKARNANPISSTSNVTEVVEIRINGELLWASEAVAAARAEVDMLSERVAALEVAVDGETEVSEEEFLVLTESLKRQLLKLDDIEAEGEVSLQIKDEECRVQNLVDTLDSLKARNANPFSITSNGREVEEIRKNNELLKASEAVAGVRSEVDILSGSVAALEVAVDGRTEVSEEEFLKLADLLERQLVKLDAIEAEGEVKLQRNAEVYRVRYFVDTINSLKERNDELLSSTSDVWDSE